MKRFMVSLRACLVLLAAFSVLLGGVYPLAVMAVAQLAFPEKSNGSLLMRNGKIIGSELLGQSFSEPRYFWGRLSATTPPYNPSASAASNLSPANPALLKAARARLAALQKYVVDEKRPVPVDLVTASASGLDPDISLEAALYQAPRVAKERRMGIDKLHALIESVAQEDIFTGQRRVNVLRLNLALDAK